MLYNYFMTSILLLFIFCFGAIIGSFLNVVIDRFGTGRSLGGRSKCDATGKTLKWFELIPIFSFICLGGCSRYTKTKLSWQYPLVELFTGLIFFLIALRFIPLIYSCPGIFLTMCAFYFLIFSYLILIFVYDFKHKIIPNTFVYPLIFLSLLLDLWRPEMSIDHLAGALVAFPVYAIWQVTRGKGMGFADVLLLIPVGFILGISGGFAALLLAFWVGAVFGILLIIFGKKKLKSEIPFGPFIILGFTIAFLYNIDMHSISTFFGSLI